MAGRGEPIHRDDPQAVAGLTERRRRRGQPVGSEVDIEKRLAEDICACGRHGDYLYKGQRCDCGRIVGKD